MVLKVHENQTRSKLCVEPKCHETLTFHDYGENANKQPYKHTRFKEYMTGRLPSLEEMLIGDR